MYGLKQNKIIKCDFSPTCTFELGRKQPKISCYQIENEGKHLLFSSRGWCLKVHPQIYF
jgi:hypothetical protein